MDFKNYTLTRLDLWGLTSKETKRLRAQMHELKSFEDRGEHLKASELKETIRNEVKERRIGMEYDER